jgi:hypothetical protein
LDALCVYDCDKKSDDGVVDSLDNIPPSDRRYWLLTVVAGLFGPQDFPILEEKLAKLYRIAFLRQQAKHLGIATVKNFTSNETDESFSISPTRTFRGQEKIRTERFSINRHVYERQVLRMKRQRNEVKPETTTTPKGFKSFLGVANKSPRNRNKTLEPSRNFLQKVSVMIHNVVHGDEEKDSIDSNKIDLAKDRDKNNQTEIVYSVIFDGKPILARTAGTTDNEIIC